MTTQPESGSRERIPARPPTAMLRDLLTLSDEFEAHVGRELTVNPTDLQAMQHLIMDGPLSPTELSKRLGISTAATTTVVDRLVAVGHASRTQHPTDRRAVVIVPEPGSVRKAMGTLMPMIMGIDGVLDEFDATEQNVISAYLTRVLEVYREHLPESPTTAGGPERTPL
ncbi:DNA-binding MarR family transcriptional regulator [Microbacteriaceae bacterium SG_E_30_P1]|uniref:DNA-binding MarR family transcriptional regulator n=1 Tax=Antiquaquibacter oligotrophicus TaxID=2880260 RepID=A0ABT6KN26_9MICO|nr:MarR family transcriptional regulator [Antiquaquibacter oligotrophicus]MDH6181408.1 DNA-binding MarR family transcriptional regulator [Antiquaquibacter oligotrophicus]UDF12900.1 MarR family transcriptional regulator [Antiquaquibacter oligotrophicus]